MKRRAVLIILGIVVLASGSPSVAEVEAENAAVEASTLFEVVAELDHSLNEIAQLLERLVKNQHAEILLRRIDLGVRRLAPLEDELRRAERRVIDSKSDIHRFETMIADVEDAISEEVLEGVDPAESGNRRMKEEVERELRVRIEELESLERRAQDLEIDLADGRREIEVLDDVLKNALESVTDR